MKKKLLSIISLFLALLTVISCTPTPPADTTESTTEELIITTAAPETEPPIIIPEGIILAGGDFGTLCRVTAPDGFAGLLRLGESFAEYVNSTVPGADIKATYDKSAQNAEYTVNISAPDVKLEGEYLIALEGKAINVKGKDENGIREALSYLKATAVKEGYFVIPESMNFSTGKGPQVLSQTPENLYYYEDVYTPELSYTFSAANLDKEACRLIVSGVDMTDDALWENERVSLDGFTVNAGDHTVLLLLRDKSGNIETYETSFSCGDGSVMNLYSGEVHAHTGDSDGKSTVKEAYKYARDTAKLDFFAVTDHSNSFNDEVYKNSHITNANNYNEPGKFVALYGYEQTYSYKNGYFGHLNTINYNTLTSNSTPLKQYYAVMARDKDAVVMFNHPGYKWGNFLEYDLYSETYDSVIDLAEIKGKSYDTEYALSLTKGWHISPIYNEDNHDANWGNAYEYCGYALAPSLTRQNIIEAFKKNRTYTTTDKSLKIYYKINDEWMGSRLENPDKLKVSVTISTEKSYGLGVISLVAEDNIVVATNMAGTKKSVVWEFEIDPLYDYYYIKVDSNSSKTWCVTAPIWIENREQLTMNSLSQTLLDDHEGTKDYRISVTLTNNTAEIMTDIKVNFFSSTRSGFDIKKYKPSATATIAEIKPGQTVTICGDIRYDSSKPAVFAVAEAKQGGKIYGAVKYLEISNLYFTEIVPTTSIGGSDIYEYIELYNNSDTPLDLSPYKLRYYPKTGAKTDDLNANQWALKGIIQPHSTLVLWIVASNNKATVADFNARYGTSLVEGRDIVRIVGNTIPQTNAVQLEIIKGSAVVARCWYSWGLAKDILANKAIEYNCPTDCTFTAKVFKSRQTPTPGSIRDDQMPEVVKQ